MTRPQHDSYTPKTWQLENWQTFIIEKTIFRGKQVMRVRNEGARPFGKCYG